MKQFMEHKQARPSPQQLAHVEDLIAKGVSDNAIKQCCTECRGALKVIRAGPRPKAKVLEWPHS